MADQAAAPQQGDKQVLSWQDLEKATDAIASQVGESGFVPSIIIAIARGGMVPAGILAYKLGVRLADVINVEFYTDMERTRPDPVLLAPMLETQAVSGQRILVVDDVATSGRTLSIVMKLLRGFGADVRSAVVCTKPGTIIAPDFRWRTTQGWIVFPWSSIAPTTAGD